jgi:hypothetical protein
MREAGFSDCFGLRDGRTAGSLWSAFCRLGEPMSLLAHGPTEPPDPTVSVLVLVLLIAGLMGSLVLAVPPRSDLVPADAFNALIGIP